jgi:hypothetical protein
MYMLRFPMDVPFMLPKWGQLQDRKLQSVMLQIFLLKVYLDESVIIAPNLG